MSVHFVKGTDPILRAEEVGALVMRLLGGEDRSLALEEFTILADGKGADEDDADEDGDIAGSPFATALNAAQTPPMMTTKRVVVVHDAGNLAPAELTALETYVADPTPTTELVLVAGGTARKASATMTALEKLARSTGDVVGPASEKPSEVLQRELEAAGLSMTTRAAQLLVKHVGDDAGLIPGLVDTLAAVHGSGAELDAADVEPYLGEAGAIPMWDLTNAIERGDVAESLAVVQRLLTTTSPSQPKAPHALEVMGFLHGHYRRLLRLDDPEIRGNEAAAAALGGRMSPRAAGYRLRQARALGTDGLRQAFDHLSTADLDLKGERAIPADAVMAVLVARLAALTNRTAAGRSRRG
jgi:DNA polymerase-3 subunit delta